MIKCRIWWDTSSSAYCLSCSYSEGFISAIKTLIPSGDRSFDSNTKFWFIKENYGEMLRQLAQQSFGLPNVSFVSKQTAEQSAQSKARMGAGQGAYLNPASGGTTEDAVIAFMQLVPYAAAKKCYLLASMELHPDKPTGDGVKMSKLNELWLRLEKEFYKR